MRTRRENVTWTPTESVSVSFWPRGNTTPSGPVNDRRFGLLTADEAGSVTCVALTREEALRVVEALTRALLADERR